MKWLITTSLSLFFSFIALANEVIPSDSTVQAVPEVGKHVGGNMDAMSMIVSLLMVLALIVITAFILKRFQPNRFDNKDLKIITRLQLGTKESLIVVQVGEKQQLLGVTSGQITLLDTLDEPLVSHANNLKTSDIGQSLVQLFKKSRANKNTNNQAVDNGKTT